MKIRNILPEFKIAGQPDPKDAADYKEKMKTLKHRQLSQREKKNYVNGQRKIYLKKKF